MRRSPKSNRAGRFPSRRDLDASPSERVAPPAESPPDDDHDDETDANQVGRTVARWPRESTTTIGLGRTDGNTSTAVASRHRMAWMLGHAPEFSHLGGPDAVADRTDLTRLRLDSPFDATGSRPTELASRQRTETWQHARYHERTRYAASDRDEPSTAAAPHRFTDEQARGSPSPRYFNQDEDVPRPRYFSQDSDALDPEYPQEDETKGRPWTTIASPRVRIDGNTNDYDGSDEGVEDDDTEIKTPEPNVPKTSRYLREMDRRVILDRLAQGEKQAPLAKEFNVSRAAISNLFKHRHEILARSDENPFAKHPKTKKKMKAKQRQQQQQARARSLSESHATNSPVKDPRAAADASESVRTLQGTAPASAVLQQQSVLVTTGASQSSGSTVLIARSRALPFLLSTMSDSTRSLQEFRCTTERALWLLLEEALATVPVESVPSEFDQVDTLSNVVTRFPPCAISMEKDSLDATPMLNIFQLMEPHQPSGRATVSTATTDCDALAVEIAVASLPPTLRGYNVFVVDVVAASGEAVCAAIERLLRHFGVVEANVTVVSLFASSEVVAMVQCKYALAKIVTARIDSTITRRRLASTPVDLLLQRMRQAYSQ